MKTIIMDGMLTAASPLAIILPGSEDGRTPAEPPIKRTMQDGVPVTTLYVPPSSVRGKLRHLASEALMRAQNQVDGRVFAPQDYIFTALGGWKDTTKVGTDARDVFLAQIKDRREKNPIVSLFGAMDAQIAGKLMVSGMTPTIAIRPDDPECVYGRGQRTDPFQRHPVLGEIMDPAELDSFSTAMAFQRKAREAEQVANDLGRKISEAKRSDADKADIKALVAEQKATKEEAKALFEKAGKKNTLQRPLQGYAAIPEGTAMEHRMRLLDGSPVELAVFLLALDLFAKRPLIGGHAAHGCGEVAGAWNVRASSEAGALAIGDITLDPWVGIVVDTDDPDLIAAEKCMRAFKDQVSAFDLRNA